MAAGHPRVRIDHTQLFALGSEPEPLVMNLDAQREGLIRKIEGLDDAMERQALTASSSSLLELVKHAVTWERRWFQVIMGGRECPEGWPEVSPCARKDIIECNVRYVMFHAESEPYRGQPRHGWEPVRTASS